jgi:hypothetical protein
MSSHSVSNDEAVLLDPTWTDVDILLPQFVDLHISCCENDGTIATFLPPWDRLRMERWYSDRIDEVRSKQRHIFLYFSNASSIEGQRRLAGLVMLGMPFSQTGPFRGSVEKLFVSPDFRKR